ncbi:unnamed protein product [Bursaphelenchus xylophilus]|uniref:(pine wood nematode) hypothetical protein n=1 Tax=Bursaphelenchus xylophilus TaxID=6326 RepID=A0A1I7SR57_BURXY|nr:unnamed protein product [Bursaphelenchus xylophilus]CAG9110863.1 unnamed protein product [Bursaphelenchus xylophilus]
MTTHSSPTIFESFSPTSVRSAPLHHKLCTARTYSQHTPPIQSPLCKHSHDSNGPCGSPKLVERCVVVAKHPDGYGLTVTGEHPVYVETVKHDGAAARAGVRVGDQITKINGMPVSSSNHYEVLRMISAGPNVALTLLGESLSCDSCRPMFFEFFEEPRRRRTGTSEGSTSSSRNPESADNSRQSSFNTVDKSLQRVRGLENHSRNSYQSTSSDDQLEPTDIVEPVRAWVNSGGKHYAQGSLKDLTETLGREDELEHDRDVTAEEAAPVTLNSMGNPADLRRNPDELAGFLNYTVHHGDPSSTLFYLITAAFQSCTAPLKELRRFAYEIFSTFLIPGAPLIVPGITQVQIQSIDRILGSFNSNQSNDADQLKKVFISCRSKALSSMEDNFGEYKRSLMIAQKPDSRSESKSKYAEQLLMSILEELLQLCGNDLEKADSRGLALLISIASVIKVVLNIKPSQLNWEKLIEKCPTFITSTAKSGVFRMKPMMPKRAVQIMDHQFNLQSVYLTVHCYQCRDAVWGVNPQAYFCQNCDVIVHKQCTNSLADRCYPATQKSRSHTAQTAKQQQRPRTASTLNLSSTTSALSQLAQPAPVHQNRHVLDTRSMGYDPGAHTTPFYAQMENALEPPSHPPPDIPVQAKAVTHVVEAAAKSTSSDSGIGADVDNKPVSRSQSIKTKTNKLEDVNEQPGMEYEENATVSVKGLDVKSISGSSAISVNADGMLDIAANDSDLEMEVDLPPLDQIISWQILKRIDPKLRKLQESINEFYHTERSHVRNLKVIYRVFHRPIVEQKLVSKDFLKVVFANLDELIEIHSGMFQKMRVVVEQWKKDPQYDGLYAKLGSTIATFFADEDGEKFKKAASLFCENQQYGLKLLGERRQKDENLAAFLQKAESNPLCRKFQLKDLLPVEMQRLVKYPLLLDTILRYTSESSEEFQQYTDACNGAKKLLSAVNTAKRDAENKRHLEEIHRKIEMPTTNRPYDDVIRRFDIMQYRYVYNGDVTWRHSRGKTEMHLVLLDYLLLILTKANDGKYYMRTSEFNAVPLLWLPSVTVEEKTGDKRAFVIFYERDLRTYELQAQSVTEKKTWEQLLRSQISAAKSDLPQNFETDFMNVMPKLKSAQLSTDDAGSPSSSNEVAEEVQVTMHAGLVKASEIVIQKPQILIMEQAQAAKVTAQPAKPPVLSPAERMRRSDQQITQALVEKHNVMASELMKDAKLAKEDMEMIAETLTGMSTINLRNRKPNELALSAIVHGNRLIDCINTRMSNRRQDSDKISEDAERHLPFVPCYKLTAVAAPLMNHLTALSQVIKEQRDTIEELKKELNKNRIDAGGAKDRSVSEETLTEPSGNIVLRSPSRMA